MITSVKYALTLILLCASSVLCADITDVNNAELQELIKKGVAVIDVRRLDEWQQTGVIEGAHTLTFFDKNGRYDADKWLTALDEIAPKGTPVVLICAAGYRSKNIAGLLDKRLGYTGVHNHTKGMYDWIEKGHPVIKYRAEKQLEKK